MRARALESDCQGLSHNICNPGQNFLGLNFFTCKVGMRKLMSQSCKNILIKNILFPFKMRSVAHFKFEQSGKSENSCHTLTCDAAYSFLGSLVIPLHATTMCYFPYTENEHDVSG